MCKTCTLNSAAEWKVYNLVFPWNTITCFKIIEINLCLTIHWLKSQKLKLFTAGKLLFAHKLLPEHFWKMWSTSLISKGSQGNNLLLDAIRLPSGVECVNKDEARVEFLKNKNKSGGARQAGSGHERLGQIPVPNQGKQSGSKGSAELAKVRRAPPV